MAQLPHDYEGYLYARNTFHVESDFEHFVTGDKFTSLVADGGTSASVGDAANGILALVTGATDNNEAAVRTTAELFLVANDKPHRFLGIVQYAEAATDDANVLIGFMSALAANSLVDDGAGVRTTGNYFVFFKVDGGTTWQVRSRNGSETETNDTGITAGGATAQRFRIDLDNEGNGGTNVRATFWIDDVQCRDATTLRPIVHTIAISGSTEMHAGVYVKAGSANSETVNVDFLHAGKRR